MVYRIYAKHKDDKRFGPLGSGGIVGNLIHAYFWNEDQLEFVQKELNILIEDNPDFSFEIRKSKWNSISEQNFSSVRMN